MTADNVRRFCFGAGPIGSLAGQREDEPALRAVDAAWQAGVRSFDTAPSYGDGEAERLLGQALRERPRQEYTLSTKVGRVTMAIRNPYEVGTAEPRRTPTFDFSRDGVRRSLDASLARLGVDRVDTVFIHDPDEHLDQVFQDTLPTLRELRDTGVIGRIGVGTTKPAVAGELVARQALDVVMLAGTWTLTERSGAELLEQCHTAGVPVLAAAPFASGLLASARPRPGAAYYYRSPDPELFQKVFRLADLCLRYGAELPQVAIQFPLRHPAVEQVVVGIRSAGEVDSDLRHLHGQVPEQLWQDLDGHLRDLALL